METNTADMDRNCPHGVPMREHCCCCDGSHGRDAHRADRLGAAAEREKAFADYCAERELITTDEDA